tara:strand:- start:822 stop:1067 length:246 start_codon:yes stop_codon:yes gene_type:complete
MKKYYLCFEVTYKANIEIEYEEGEDFQNTYERAEEYVRLSMDDVIQPDIQMEDVTERVVEDKVLGYKGDEEWLEVKLEEAW